MKAESLQETQSRLSDAKAEAEEAAWSSWEPPQEAEEAEAEYQVLAAPKASQEHWEPQ